MATPIVSDTVLIESRAARENQLGGMPHDKAESILGKLNGLYFALWQGVGVATSEQIKEFYAVDIDAVESALRRYRDEFESDGLKTLKGKQLKDFKHVSADAAEASRISQLVVWTPRSALRLGMVLKNSAVAKVVRTSLLDGVEHAIPAQAQEIERIKLELQLIQAKQKYLDVSYAIQLSTSSAMLNYLRGDAPPPKDVEHVKHFVDAHTGREVGSTEGRSLTQLITDAGLNPKSTRDRNRVKKILKSCGMDYDKMQSWSTASYLRKYPVLEDQIYDQALKAVLGEVITGESEQNLFVHQMQQAALNPQKQPRGLQGVEP